MQTKIKTYRNGWLAMLEKTASLDAPYVALVRTATGEIYDKRRCDDYRNALDYYRCFSLIAKDIVCRDIVLKRHDIDRA